MTNTGISSASKSRQESEKAAKDAANADPTAPPGVLSSPALTELPAQSESTLGEPAFRAHQKSREEMEAIHQDELRAQSERTA